MSFHHELTIGRIDADAVRTRARLVVVQSLTQGELESLQQHVRAQLGRDVELSRFRRQDGVLVLPYIGVKVSRDEEELARIVAMAAHRELGLVVADVRCGEVCAPGSWTRSLHDGA